MRISDGNNTENTGHFERLLRRAALCVLLVGAAAAEATATEYNVRPPLNIAANQPVNLNGHVQVTSPLWVGNGASIFLNVTGGLTGMGKAPAGARLDVQSTGSGKVQLWRNSGGSEVASISDAGALSPTQTCNTTYPAGALIFMNAACPSGWTELTGLAGRYLVGGTANIGTSVGTALSNLENRAAGQHNHPTNDPGHYHSGTRHLAGYSFGTSITYFSAANANVTANAAANVSVTNPTCTGCTTAGTNAPYVQFRLCQKN